MMETYTVSIGQGFGLFAIGVIVGAVYGAWVSAHSRRQRRTR